MMSQNHHHHLDEDVDPSSSTSSSQYTTFIEQQHFDDIAASGTAYVVNDRHHDHNLDHSQEEHDHHIHDPCEEQKIMKMFEEINNQVDHHNNIHNHHNNIHNHHNNIHNHHNSTMVHHPNHHDENSSIHGTHFVQQQQQQQQQHEHHLNFDHHSLQQHHTDDAKWTSEQLQTPYDHYPQHQHQIQNLPQHHRPHEQQTIQNNNSVNNNNNNFVVNQSNSTHASLNDHDLVTHHFNNNNINHHHQQQQHQSHHQRLNNQTITYNNPNNNNDHTTSMIVDDVVNNVVVGLVDHVRSSTPSVSQNSMATTLPTTATAITTATTTDLNQFTLTSEDVENVVVGGDAAAVATTMNSDSGVRADSSIYHQDAVVTTNTATTAAPTRKEDRGTTKILAFSLTDGRVTCHHHHQHHHQKQQQQQQQVQQVFQEIQQQQVQHQQQQVQHQQQQVQHQQQQVQQQLAQQRLHIHKHFQQQVQQQVPHVQQQQQQQHQQQVQQHYISRPNTNEPTLIDAQVPITQPVQAAVPMRATTTTQASQINQSVPRNQVTTIANSIVQHSRLASKFLTQRPSQATTTSVLPQTTAQSVPVVPEQQQGQLQQQVQQSVEQLAHQQQVRQQTVQILQQQLLQQRAPQTPTHLLSPQQHLPQVQEFHHHHHKIATTSPVYSQNVVQEFHHHSAPTASPIITRRTQPSMHLTTQSPSTPTNHRNALTASPINTQNTQPSIHVTTQPPSTATIPGTKAVHFHRFPSTSSNPVSSIQASTSQQFVNNAQQTSVSNTEAPTVTPTRTTRNFPYLPHIHSPSHSNQLIVDNGKPPNVNGNENHEHSHTITTSSVYKGQPHKISNKQPIFDNECANQTLQQFQQHHPYTTTIIHHHHHHHVSTDTAKNSTKTKSSSSAVSKPLSSSGSSQCAQNKKKDFEYRFKELLKYKHENGNLMVPHKYPKNRSLGTWVDTQRRRYRKYVAAQKEQREYKAKQSNDDSDGNKSMPGKVVSVMSEDEVRRLLEIGFVFEPRPSRQATWNKRFEELQKYKEQHGHCNVREDDVTNPGLGKWVSYLRRSHRLAKQGRRAKGKRLSDDRISQLNAIGFVFELKEELATKRYRDGIHLLKEFLKKEGHCDIPAFYPTNPTLGLCVEDMRKEYRKYASGKGCALDQNLVDELTEIGFLSDEHLLVPVHIDNGSGNGGKRQKPSQHLLKRQTQVSSSNKI